MHEPHSVELEARRQPHRDGDVFGLGQLRAGRSRREDARLFRRPAGVRLARAKRRKGQPNVIAVVDAATGFTERDLTQKACRQTPKAILHRDYGQNAYQQKIFLLKPWAIFSLLEMARVRGYALNLSHRSQPSLGRLNPPKMARSGGPASNRNGVRKGDRPPAPRT